MKKTWSVLVVYEDAAGREQAVRFCEGLVEKFWSQCGFDVEWYSFGEVGGQVKRAADADLIVVAMKPEGEVPFELAEWTEGWLRDRREREGAIIGLIHPADESAPETSRQGFLRYVAHRAGMDFLTQVPPTLAPIPDSLESYSQRAGQVTSVLDEIIHRQRSPSTTR